MRKKRVAVFGNGWSDEYLKTALDGIHKCAQEYNVDLYLFIEYSSVGSPDSEAQGHINIINLADFKSYDGVLLLGNTLNNNGELAILRDRILETGVPAVCLEYELDGIDCICTDNYSGMRELCDHIIKKHGVRDVVYVAGERSNLENIERRKALEDSLATQNLILEADHVIEGEWSYYTVQQLIPDWIKENGVPDAFVCANDVMAMGVIFALLQMDIEVPEDVIVTGFDHILSSQTFSPIITTVDRGWDQRSYEGMLHLIGLMNGEASKGTIKAPSKLSVGESCGCPVTATAKKFRNHYINNSYVVPIARTMFDWHLSGLDTVTNTVKKLEDMHEGFSNLFKASPEIGYSVYEGDTFCICLDEAFENSISESVPARHMGYGDTMDVIFAMRNGEVMPRHKIKKSYIFPIFGKSDEPACTYMISPLHHGDTVLGYAVFKNQYRMIDQYYLQSWLNHMSIGLLHAEQSIRMETMNQKLNEMSVMDELSGLLNRKGYEKRAIPYLEELHKDGRTGILMVVDINSMKEINDRYGHLQGDLAIRLVSKAITATIPEDWYGVRYGGDEFVVLGEKKFIDDGSAFKNQICDAVKKQAEDMMLPFELTVSVGSVIIDKDENLSYNEYFKMADNAMYEMKKAIHSEDKN